MKSKPVILYVENDATSRTIMRQLLETRMGLENVTIFEDSRSFLTRVRALRPVPNVIFLDIQATPFSGFEMLAMLRLDTVLSSTQIIAVTAGILDEEAYQLSAMGFNGCLAKPHDDEVFRTQIDQILAGEDVWDARGTRFI